MTTIHAKAFRCNCTRPDCGVEPLVVYRRKGPATAVARRSGWKRRFGEWFAPGHFVAKTKKSSKPRRTCARCQSKPTVCNDGRLARHRCADGLYYKEPT